MKSNYKKLGQFIHQVSIKNSDLRVDNLLGVSITKEFIKSIANTIGTDMTTYKIVKKNQFTYGSITSRNGDKISIALLQEDEAIVSTSYTVFEIIDTNELLPEYLMMWFRRPEFDRYARYMSHGSTREAFGWEEMCDVELPIPTLEKQKEIIKEYHTITDRIKLNEQLSQKLEDTAQSIYKEWFVNFEFPDENGNPYKSNGGAMEYCDELEMERPKGWKISYLSKIATYLNGLAMQKYECETEEYLPVLKIKELNQGYTDINSGKVTLDIPKDYIVLEGDVIFSWSASLKVDIWSGGTCGLNQHLFKVTSNQYEKWFYYLATKYHLSEFIRIAEGNKTSMGHIKREHLDNAIVFIPNSSHFEKINKLMNPLLKNIILTKKEKFELMKFQETLLSKMVTIEG